MSKLSLPFLTSVLIIIASFIVIYSRNLQPNTYHAPCDPILVCPTIFPTSTSTKWKTYQGNSFRFNFPPDWIARPPISPSPNSTSALEAYVTNPDSTVTLGISSNIEGYGLECFSEIKETNNKLVIDGIVASKVVNRGVYDGKLCDDLLKRDLKLIFVFFNKNNNRYHLSYSYQIPNEQYALEVFEQIMSSFKFLDQNSPTPYPNPTTHSTLPTTYICPPSGWVDCLPGPGPAKPQCQPDYLNWIQSNCPDFSGVAY